MSQLTTGQPAPDFSTTDVTGNPISLRDYRGKTVLLTFQRNVGCPVCNLRYHELQTQQDSLRASGIEVLAFYESSTQNMRQYLNTDQQTGSKPNPPFALMIPDPEEKLYELYGVERSVGKMLSGVLLHGGFGKMSASKKLTPNLPKQDGHLDRVGADFVIDPSGRIVRAHYHRFVGDDLPLSGLLNPVTG